MDQYRTDLPLVVAPDLGRPPEPLAKAPPARQEVARFVWSAIGTALLVASGGLSLLAWLYSLTVMYAGDFWRGCAFFVLSGGGITGAVFGLYLLIPYAVYDLRKDDGERQHRKELERLAARAVGTQVATAPAPQAPPTHADLLRLAGLRILHAHYARGEECTRPECEKWPNPIPQDAWKEVNAALRLLGIKGERKWLEVPPAEAQERWLADIRFNGDGTCDLRTGKNQWKQRLPLK